MNTKRTSVGILCFTKKGNDIKYLMVEKKHTYFFLDFVLGKYTPAKLPILISKMTIIEKTMILSFNFEFIWYYTFLGNEIFDKNFATSREKFINMTRSKQFEQIKELLLTSSTHGELIWEFPKGRSQLCKSITDSMREFQEETGLKYQDDYIFVDNKPNRFTIIGDDDIIYDYYYYLAYCPHDPNNTEKRTVKEFIETQEVKKIKWKSIEDIRKLSNRELIINIINTFKEDIHVFCKYSTTQ